MTYLDCYDGAMLQQASDMGVGEPEHLTRLFGREVSFKHGYIIHHIVYVFN